MTSERTAALRLIGAGVAVIIATVIAAIPSIAWQFNGLWAGVPSVLVLGFWLGPRVVDRPATATVVLMLGAVALSALFVALIGSADASTDPLTFVAAAVVGVAIFGLPALMLTGPAAVAWLLVMRRIAERGDY